MGAIFKREISSYFNSAVAYIVMAMFFGFSGYFFLMTCFNAYYTSSSLRYTILNMFLVVILLTPILTMKSFSEERRQRTDQALLTSPVSLFSIVMGKFLSAFTLFAGCCLIFIVYGIVLSLFGSPQWSVLLCSVAGLLLVGGALIAIDIFISSLTESQAVSAVLGMVIGLVIYLLPTIASSISITWISRLINNLSFYTYLDSITYGLFDLSGIVYFISVIALFCFLTSRVIEKRRWS